MVSKADVAVVGAALNGLAMAVALAGPSARRPVKVIVVDAKDPAAFNQNSFDGRASAITASSRRMFEAMGIWQEICDHAQPMSDIIVTDALPGYSRRPQLLRFDESGSASEPTAYMVENRFLYQALFGAALTSPHIAIRSGSAITDYRFGPGLAIMTLADGETISASLIAAADGRHSPARAAAGLEVVGWSYDQTGIVVTVAHELAHNGRAEEHFTPSGPFAILPLPGNMSSLVWTEKTSDAERILALDDRAFLIELKRRFGPHLGEVKLASGRHGYPLALFVAREFHSNRLALVGDAAHVLHPLAGLGFNLGLRDVAALSECLADAVSLGQDIGGETTLGRYTSWRRFDTVTTAAAMEGMNRLFSNDNGFLRLLRTGGLLAVDRLRPLKHLLAREAAGQSGRLPKLLRGDPV